MARLQSLTRAACALVLPAAAVVSTAWPAAATPESAVPASAPASTSLSAAGRADRPDPVLAVLTSEGRPPAWLDGRSAPRRSDGGSTAGPTGGSDSYSAGPWCHLQCITSGVAYARGSDVEIVVHTSVFAQLFVSVVRDDDADGVTEYSEFATSPGLATEITMVVGDLEPGATYLVMAAATDAYGTSHVWGEFTAPA
jgi:hypothetical protein